MSERLAAPAASTPTASLAPSRGVESVFSGRNALTKAIGPTSALSPSIQSHSEFRGRAALSLTRSIYSAGNQNLSAVRSSERTVNAIRRVSSEGKTSPRFSTTEHAPKKSSHPLFQTTTEYQYTPKVEVTQKPANLKGMHTLWQASHVEKQTQVQINEPKVHLKPFYTPYKPVENKPNGLTNQDNKAAYDKKEVSFFKSIVSPEIKQNQLPSDKAKHIGPSVNSKQDFYKQQINTEVKQAQVVKNLFIKAGFSEQKANMLSTQALQKSLELNKLRVSKQKVLPTIAPQTQLKEQPKTELKANPQTKTKTEVKQLLEKKKKNLEPEQKKSIYFIKDEKAEANRLRLVNEALQTIENEKKQDKTANIRITGHELTARLPPIPEPKEVRSGILDVSKDVDSMKRPDGSYVKFLERINRMKERSTKEVESFIHKVKKLTRPVTTSTVSTNPVTKEEVERVLNKTNKTFNKNQFNTRTA